VSRPDRQRLLKQKGVVVWMTGLSGAGKSTIAALLERMIQERGKLSYRLDGDNIRMGLNRDLGFSPAERAENIRRIGEVARLFVDAGVIVIVSFISPYRIARDAVRASLGTGDFIEAYIRVSVQAAEKRDPKGLYKKARAGQIKEFTGIDDAYEAPAAPEIVVDTEACSALEGAQLILDYLQGHGHLEA